jgi:hypothetical protein
MGDLNFGHTMLDAVFEESFQNWYAKISAMNNLSRNPDDPQHFYDWRGFYMSGMASSPDVHDIDQDTGLARMHFPDEFKTLGHPNTFWAANDLNREGVQIRPDASIGLQRHRFDGLLEMQ